MEYDISSADFSCLKENDKAIPGIALSLLCFYVFYVFYVFPYCAEKSCIGIGMSSYSMNIS